MPQGQARFSLFFLVVLLVLFSLELLSVTQHYVVLPWTEFLATLSSSITSFFDADAISQGIVLRDQQSGFAVSIQPGCNGIEATIVLIAAVVAFPSTLKDKIQGIAWGFIAIQLLNVGRIISLFYLGQWNKTAFDWAHSYIWQALIMLDVLIVFILWVRVVRKKAQASEINGEAALSISHEHQQ